MEPGHQGELYCDGQAPTARYGGEQQTTVDRDGWESGVWGRARARLRAGCADSMGRAHWVVHALEDAGAVGCGTNRLEVADAAPPRVCLGSDRGRPLQPDAHWPRTAQHRQRLKGSRSRVGAQGECAVGAEVPYHKDDQGTDQRNSHYFPRFHAAALRASAAFCDRAVRR
eukprot:scaffold26690_cov112-Isochrysis_galbana.AAC.1